ncbi:MAG: hypothetical protein M3483_08205 [Gemmatimonadota bacterium]|nr:hypothetical protein [Gemmatimonadota bacterium]
MSGDGSGGHTFDTVRARYREWFGQEARPLPGRDAADGSEYWEREPSGDRKSRVVGMGIGATIGVALLALAGLSLRAAVEWSGIARGGASTGYALIAIFLVIAGLGCILSTWNHSFRASNRPEH